MDTKQNILLLKTLVEESIKRKIKTSSDFIYLAEAINSRLHDSLGISTLKRIWGYVEGYRSIRESSLDVLCRFVGYPDYHSFISDFCCNKEFESSQILLEKYLCSADLSLCDVVEIQWNPDRICYLAYLGDDKFEVISSKNSKLSIGDTFKCKTFYLNRSLILEDFVHENEPACKFVVGNRGGLSVIRVIDSVSRVV